MKEAKKQTTLNVDKFIQDFNNSIAGQATVTGIVGVLEQQLSKVNNPTYKQVIYNDLIEQGFLGGKNA